MADRIEMDPRQAGETLEEVQGTLKNFLNEVTELGHLLNQVNNHTNSTPLSEAMAAAAAVLNDCANAVNAGISAYSAAFVTVVAEWIASDATAAGRISFEKLHFDNLIIHPCPADHVHVEPHKIRHFLEQMNEHTHRLNGLFHRMTNEIHASARYWIGDGADHSRATWDRKVVPVSHEVNQHLHRAHDKINHELESFIIRERTTRID